MAELYVGTSGWSYSHWRERFYPKGVGNSRWLAYYVTQFNAVEVNATYYRLPKDTTIAKWHDTAPANFVFVIKASRQITHFKRLTDCDEPLGWLLDRVRPLGDHLGPILFQLPPSFHKDLARLGSFFHILPAHGLYVLEFRHESWDDPETIELLRRHGIAYCIVSAPKVEPVIEVTAPFAYFRMHGPGRWYRDSYTEDQLEWWARQIRPILDQGTDVYVFFNNDIDGHAPHNAAHLRSILEHDRLNDK